MPHLDHDLDGTRKIIRKVIEFHADEQEAQGGREAMKRIGVADTTFARVDMGGFAVDELKATGTGFKVERCTVPGVKDLPVAAQEAHRGARVRDRDGARDARRAGHRQDLRPRGVARALIQVQLMTNRHIIEVFVHEDEAASAKELAWLAERRREGARGERVRPAVQARAARGRNAGKGLRQGFEDVGPIM